MRGSSGSRIPQKRAGRRGRDPADPATHSTMTNGTRTHETDGQEVLYCNYCGDEIGSGRFCGAVCQLAAETEEEL